MGPGIWLGATMRTLGAVFADLGVSVNPCLRYGVRTSECFSALELPCLVTDCRSRFGREVRVVNRGAPVF